MRALIIFNRFPPSCQFSLLNPNNHTIKACRVLTWFWVYFQVWQNYTCRVSSTGICTTVGRVTPDVYTQLTAAVNESYALEHYTPPLLSLQDCNFVRDTFQNITSSYCPPLDRYLKTVNAGLAMISVGVLLCLVLWILYANRPQREEVFVKLSSLLKGRINKGGVNSNNSDNHAPSNILEV